MQKNEIKANIYAILGMAFWGLSFAWTQYLLDYYSPIIVILIRLTISTVFLFSFLMISRKIEKISFKLFWKFLLLSLFMPTLYFVGEHNGIKLTSSTTSALIISSIPIFMGVIAFVWTKEKLSKLNLLGLLISFVGVGFIVFENGFNLEGSLLGMIYLFMAVAAAVAYTMLLKDMSQKFNAIFIIALQNLIGIFYFLPFLYFENEVHIVINSQIVLYFLFLGVLCSSIAFIFYTLAVKHIGMARSEAYGNLIPMIAIFYAYYFLDEVFNIEKIIGILLILSGLVLSQLHLFSKRKSTVK